MNKPRKSKPLDIEALTAAAECLKTLAHPHRLQILQLLLTGKELSVNEIAEECGLNQPTASDHLRLMQRCSFLRNQKSGRTVYYSVAEPHLQDIMDCLQNRFG